MKDGQSGLTTHDADTRRDYYWIVRVETTDFKNADALSSESLLNFKIFTLAIIISMNCDGFIDWCRDAAAHCSYRNVLEIQSLESGLMLLRVQLLNQNHYPRLPAGYMTVTGKIAYDRAWHRDVANLFMFTNLSLDTTFAIAQYAHSRCSGLSMALMPVITSALNQLPPVVFT